MGGLLRLEVGVVWWGSKCTRANDHDNDRGNVSHGSLSRRKKEKEKIFPVLATKY